MGILKNVRLIKICTWFLKNIITKITKVQAISIVLVVVLIRLINI